MNNTAIAPEQKHLELTEILNRIDALEKELAPSGVSFSTKGQDQVLESASHECAYVADSLGAATAALKILENRRSALNLIDA